MSNIKIAKVCIISGLLGLFAAYLFSDVDNRISSEFNLRKINEQGIVIGEHFFLDETVFSETIKQISVKIQTRKMLKALTGIDIPLFVGINSMGGYVRLYELLEEYGEPIKQMHVVCTVSSAASIAFTFMLNFCDERLMLPDAFVMSHQTFSPSLFSKVFNDSTYRDSLKQSDSEAEKIGQDKYFWFEYTRKQGDKKFSVDEMKKYKIATGFIEKE